MQNEKHVLPRRLRHRGLSFGAAALLIVAAALVLAACGGSSSSKTTASNAGSTSAQGKSTSGRFASLRTCLQKQGITLPGRSNGGSTTGGSPNGGSTTGGPPNGGPAGVPGGVPGGGPGGRGFKLPAGVSRAKFQEAIKKCGGGGFAGRGGRFNSATSRAALTKYASCMREHGANLPAPNTNGKGPVFDTKGINTSSTSFKNAENACQTDLKGAFGGAPPRGTPPGQAPPSGASSG